MLNAKTFKNLKKEFLSKFDKYNLDEESIISLGDYYGKFWNKKNNNILIEDSRIMIHCKSEYIGNMLMNDIANEMYLQGLIADKKIGISFLKSKEDITDIEEEIYEKKRFQTIIVALIDNEDKPSDGVNVLELLKSRDDRNELLYRDFEHHIHVSSNVEDLITLSIFERLQTDGITCNDEFKKEFAEYIRTVYPKREILEEERFITDAVRRVRTKYYGIYDFSKKHDIDVNCVPDYIKQVSDKISETIKDSEVEKEDTIKFEKLDDIDDEELETGNIENVLLLNMSTLPRPRQDEKYTTLIQNKYSYGPDENVVEVYGYGQLEPIPQLINNELKEKNKKLDLIIVTATKEALSNIVQFKLGIKEVEGIKSTGAYECSAITFFKHRMREELGEDIKFLTINIDDNKVENALYETTYSIRKVFKKDANKQSDVKPSLYIDIHGGKREDQLLFDAIITTLSIENIYVKKAYTCLFGKEKKIQDVTDNLRIFRFVSGINEFINYGSARELGKYIKEAEVHSEIKKQRKETQKIITEISDALSLCKTKEFSNKLKELKEDLDTNKVEDKLFEIFKQNIESDYGNLLGENVELKDKVNWAIRKDFIQQTVAIIEAETPEYVFRKLFHMEDDHVKVQVEVMGTYVDSTPKDLLKSNGIRIGSGKISVKRAEYMKVMFYASKDNRTEKKSFDDNKGIFEYRARDGKHYLVTFDSKKNLNKKIWNQFIKFGEQWWEIKSKIRNKVFHVDSDDESISIGNVRDKINTFQNLLKEIDKYAESDKE